MPMPMLYDDYRPFCQREDNDIKRWISGSDSSCVEIGKLISNGLGRELHVVFQRAFQLGRIRYTPFSHFLLSHRREGWRSDEIDFLISNRNESRKRLANVLDRSASAVSKQMYCFKLMAGGHDYDWSEQEQQYLASSCKMLSISQICKQLNRHPIDVKHQSLKLNTILEKSGEEFTRGGLGKKQTTPHSENAIWTRAVM